MKKNINLYNTDGLRYGFWIETEYGHRSYGYFINGEKHGYWSYKAKECADYSKGNYIHGKQIGYWEHKLEKTIPPKKIKEFHIP